MKFQPAPPLEIASALCYSLQGGSSSKLLPRSCAALPAARSSDHGRVAQLAEHSALNRQVEGSIPSASTIRINQLARLASGFVLPYRGLYQGPQQIHRCRSPLPKGRGLAQCQSPPDRSVSGNSDAWTRWLMFDLTEQWRDPGGSCAYTTMLSKPDGIEMPSRRW